MTRLLGLQGFYNLKQRQKQARGLVGGAGHTPGMKVKHSDRVYQVMNSGEYHRITGRRFNAFA
jgi:hypothetical protein